MEPTGAKQTLHENQKIHRVLSHIFKSLNVSGEPETSTLLGFENSIHITENATESLKVFVSSLCEREGGGDRM